MPYIHHKKRTLQYRLFGSLPIMCKTLNLDYELLQKHFRNNITYKDKTTTIIRVSLERGGKDK